GDLLGGGLDRPLRAAQEDLGDPLLAGVQRAQLRTDPSRDRPGSGVGSHMAASASAVGSAVPARPDPRTEPVMIRWRKAAEIWSTITVMTMTTTSVIPI